MSLLYGIIVAIILVAIYQVYKTPEQFVIIKDSENKDIILSPQEATRLGITDNQPVYDGRDRVF